MDKIKLIGRWLLRAWPFLVTGAIMAAHYSMYLFTPVHIAAINKVAAFVLQVIGGLIVLYSVNQNTGLFRQQNLVNMAAEWFRAFPLIRKSVTLSIDGACIATAGGEAEFRVTRKCNTIEEKLADLEKQIQECRQLVLDKEKRLKDMIGKVDSSLCEKIAQNVSQIDEVRSLLQESVVGGVTAQVFGVLLVVYGAAVGLM